MCLARPSDCRSLRTVLPGCPETLLVLRILLELNNRADQRIRTASKDGSNPRSCHWNRAQYNKVARAVDYC